MKYLFISLLIVLFSFLTFASVPANAAGQYLYTKGFCNMYNKPAIQVWGNAVPGAITYIVYRSGNGQTNKYLGPSNLTFIIDEIGLKSGASYQYTVYAEGIHEAFLAVGKSSWTVAPVCH